MRFVDASAVVAAYLDEPERGRMRAVLDEGDIAVSRLTEIEAASAFARLAHDGVLTPARRDDVLQKFLTDLALWATIEVTADVVSTARALLLRHRLRAGDAVQLGSALVLRERSVHPVAAFITYDRRLRDAARAERLPTFPD